MAIVSQLMPLNQNIQREHKCLSFPMYADLHQFYKELALRFAETGITALAIDYFGRTAGLTERNDGFEFWPHVQQLNVQSIFSDVTAAFAYLRQDETMLPSLPLASAWVVASRSSRRRRISVRLELSASMRA